MVVPRAGSTMTNELRMRRAVSTGVLMVQLLMFGIGRCSGDW